MRGELALKGLPLPPRGSPRDIYLQKLLVGEHERQFDMCYSVIQAVLATGAEGESRSTMFTSLQDGITNMVNKLFPYNKKKGISADRTKDDLRTLNRFMAANKPTPKQEEK